MYSEEKYFNTDELVDNALKAEPHYKLSDNFADMLAEKVSRKFAWNQYFREFLIYLGAITGLLAIPLAFQFVLFDANPQEWLMVFTANIQLVAGIIFLLVFILFTDRVLLRYFMHKTSDQV